MIRLFIKKVPAEFYPEYITKTVLGKYKGNIDKFVDDAFAKSVFCDKAKFEAFAKNPTSKVLLNDPLAVAGNDIYDKYVFLNGLCYNGEDKRYEGMRLFVAGLMEMIPMVGSGLMYILMGVVYFLTGDMVSGIQVLALTGALQLLRRILEPKLMSNSIGITPLQSVIGMFVGMQVGGILGLIGGPVAMAVLVGAVRGNVFRNFNEDLYLVVQWFKRRWAKPETQEVIPESERLQLPERAKAPAGRNGRAGKRKNRNNPG